MRSSLLAQIFAGLREMIGSLFGSAHFRPASCLISPQMSRSLTVSSYLSTPGKREEHLRKSKTARHQVQTSREYHARDVAHA